MTTIGITGANGFIGRHLTLTCGRQDDWTVRPCPRSAFDDPAEMQRFVEGCDVVVHVAGVNRGTEAEITETNPALAEKLVTACRSTGSSPRLIYFSSTQAENDNPYGLAKRRAGEILTAWANETGSVCQTLVIPNVYGPGCRPFYNSVVATFCHQIAHGEIPEVHGDREIEFLFVTELVDRVVELVEATEAVTETLRIPGTLRLTVPDLLATLQSFYGSLHAGGTGVVPDLCDTARQHLYATFQSYLEPDDWQHRPPVHSDNRGSLVEVIKMTTGGQVFFSTTKPGIVRGNHYHTRKLERFCVLKGEATIRLRQIDSDEILEFHVSGDRPQFLSIPVMHTHHIENTGDTELLTMFWCNEIFDPSDADTWYVDVDNESVRDKNIAA